MARFEKLTVSVSEREHLRAIDQRAPEYLRTLIAWSHINSGSTNAQGLEQMRAVLKPALSELPGIVSEEKLEPGLWVGADGAKNTVNYQPSLLLKIRPDAPIQIVLTGHYDTVFPKDSHFQTTTRTDEDTLGGPGVADMKGGIIVMLAALREFEKTANAQKVGYSVLLSPDEEIGSPGSAKLLAALGKSAHIGLTYEPSLADGSMVGARKGSGNFALIIRGRTAHAGREPHLGRNAIVAMAGFTTALDGLNGAREGVTFNMAKIDGGGAVNVVPDLAIGRFNVRMQEPEDQAWIQSKLDGLVADLNQQDGISAELTGGFTRPPKPMAPANEMLFNWVKRAGEALGLPISWKASGGVCEGNNLWASGCPNVDTLGVRGGDIHSDREFMKIASLSERAQLSALLLMKVASGEFDAHKAKNLARENVGEG